MPELIVQNLGRNFAVMDRSRGLWGAVRDLVRRERGTRVAVENLSFSLRSGETIALIGPNGAGKSTTIKMLTGILRPTFGTIRAGNLDPWTDRLQHVRQLGVVFGQRTQLWWDLAVIEAFDLIAAMFDVPDGLYRQRLGWLDEVLGIGPLLRKPVRQLSLGERVRCDLAAALLHDPPFLFLDEPTIGLDVAVKRRLRTFLTGLRDAGRTTVILTTHDLGDVVALCPRVLLIAEGRLLHDGPMADLTDRLGGQRTLTVTLSEPLSDPELQRLGQGLPPLIRTGPSAFRLLFGAEHAAPDLIRTVLDRAVVADLRLEEAPIEELVARFYERPG